MVLILICSIFFGGYHLVKRLRILNHPARTGLAIDRTYGGQKAKAETTNHLRRPQRLKHILYYIILYYIISYIILLVLYYILYYIILYYIISYHIILYHIILYYIILYYIMLKYIKILLLLLTHL